MAEKSFDELLADLKSDDVEARRNTLQHLGKLDDERVHHILIATLSDQDVSVRTSAILAIARRHPSHEKYPAFPFKPIPESPLYVQPLVDYLNR
jgi:vesicle coat complex subunit